MENPRSKSSLETINPYCQRISPQYKNYIASQINSINNLSQNDQTSHTPTQALESQEPENPTILIKEEILQKKENPQLEANQNSLNQENSQQIANHNLFSEIIPQSAQSQKSQNQTVNFQEFFNLKNKYSALHKINNSFLSVIESGKVTISPEKQSVCCKKDQSLTQATLDQIWSKEQQKIKIIAQKKQQILSQLNQLNIEQIQVRNKKKAVILAAKANHQSTKFIKSSRQIVESPVKRSKFMNKKSNSAQNKTVHHENKSLTKACRNSDILIELLCPKQQKISIARIIKERNQKKLHFQQKQKQMFQKIEKQKQKALQQQIQKIQQCRKRRRSKALQNMQKNKDQRKSHQRINRRSNTNFKTQSAQGLTSNQFFTQIQTSSEKKSQSLPKSLSKKYIYKRLQMQTAQKEIQRQKYEEIILKKRREEKKVNFQEIRVHLQKYKQIKMEKIQLEKQKIEALRSQQRERLKQIRQKYGFLTKIKQNMLEDERKEIEFMQSQLNTKVNYQKKMRQYFISVKDKTQQKSRVQNITNRVKTCLSVQKEQSNNQKSLQASRSLTIFKNSRIENDKEKNQKKYIPRKKSSSFGNSQAKDQIQKAQKYKNYLEQMRKNWKNNQSFESKQKTMMEILKNESSSLEEIQKAFGIFKDLNKSFWQGQSEKEKKLIMKQGHLLSSQKNQQQFH